MTDKKHYNDLIDQSYLAIAPMIGAISEGFSENVIIGLEKNIESRSTAKEHTAALECFESFKKNKHVVNKNFIEKIGDGFSLFKTNELDVQVNENDFQKEAWSLIDDDILEENICIRTLSSELTQHNKAKIWQLEQRLTFINKGLPINENRNPLSPLQFFSSVRHGLKKIPLHIAGKIICYKTMQGLLNKEYINILDAANNLLIEHDILPELNYERQHSPITSKDKPLEEKNKNTEITTPEKIQSINEVVNSKEKSNAPPENLTEDESTLSNKEVTQSETSLVNAIRKLLQRARNINNNEAPIALAKHTGKANSDPNDANEDHSANENTTASSDKQETNNSSIVQNASDQDSIDIRPQVINTESIIEAVTSVQESNATAHFFAQGNKEAVITTPTNIAENSTEIYQQLAKDSPTGSINAKNMYTIDMVGMLFDYILADENLPDSIKTLLSHLHTPFLKLAFIDESFFENKDHKSRLLLDSLADAGANFVGHDGTSQYNMYNEIKAVVQRIVKDFKHEVNLFAEVLMEFTLLKKRITHMHNLRERNSIEKKHGQEKHGQAKAIARQEIKKRIEGKRIPSAIINFLSPWFVYLTFLQLKDEKDSKQSTEALAVIDNLITYCSIKEVKDNEHEIEEGFDLIIKQVETGLIDIAYNPAKMATVLADFEQLKSNVMNRRTIKTTMTKQGSQKDSKAEKINDTPTPEEERVMNYIKLIDPGTWIEYDKNTRMKVNGFSSETRQYILINQSNQEVTMLSRLALARDILSEKATVLDGTAKPLFERALERIKHNLDKQMQLNESVSE